MNSFIREFLSEALSSYEEKINKQDGGRVFRNSQGKQKVVLKNLGGM